MLVKKFFFLLPVLFFAFQANAQVITSKKEAVKKGVYKKPAEENVSSDVKSTVAAFTGTPEKPAATKTTATATPGQPTPSAQKPAVKAAPKQVASAKPSAKTSIKSKKSLIKQTDDKDIVPDDENDNYMALQMINNAMTFIGTRYLGGGTTTAGMDCSGMVTAVYNLFDVKLPRSSNDMSKVGKKIDKDEVKKGDLVFFHTNGKRIINHVGMVIEVIGDEIKFVHSSTQKGVIVSSTKEPYYEKTFAQANRML